MEENNQELLIEETTQEESILEEGYTETEVTTETIEIITIEPDVLYEKLDDINSNLSMIMIVIMLYITFTSLGRWLHIRKEGDL